MTFVIVGDGNVSRGALTLLKCLPFEWISPDDLASLSTSTSYDNHKVYICQVKAEDYVIACDGSQFQHDRYYSHPEEFKSIFHEKIAPYARFILNGIFWTEKYPRLMTISQTEQLAKDGRLKLLTLADVSCDIDGSFEFMGKASTIDDPYFMWDPINKVIHDNIESPGIQIMSIDNLPTEMPLEASEYFSSSLFPVLSEIARGNISNDILTRATIAKDGMLAPKHQKLKALINKYAGSKTKRILLLGSGFVARPLVDYLLRSPYNSITIASNDKAAADNLSMNRSNVQIAPLNVMDDSELGKLVEKHDIVVSFVPAAFHPRVAEQCIIYKKNLVTASYISPEMAAFDKRFPKINTGLKLQVLSL